LAEFKNGEVDYYDL